MNKVFEVHEFRNIGRSLWFVPGRVYEVDLRVGDVLCPDGAQGDLALKFRIVAIETYGHALDSLSAGMSGQLVLQLPSDKADELVKQIPANVKLIAAE